MGAGLGIIQATSVDVETPDGMVTHDRSDADVFDGQTLTITNVDDHGETIYAAGMWRHATARFPNGHIAYSFSARRAS